jgi:hypothetical protein
MLNSCSFLAYIVTLQTLSSTIKQGGGSVPIIRGLDDLILHISLVQPVTGSADMTEKITCDLGIS